VLENLIISRLTNYKILQTEQRIVPLVPVSSNIHKIRDEDPDQLIFGPPDPVLFSTDPDPDPTFNNGFIKLFSSSTKYKPESTNSSIKWWFKISNFMPTYLKYKYIFFFISISRRIRSRFRIRGKNVGSSSLHKIPWELLEEKIIGFRWLFF